MMSVLPLAKIGKLLGRPQYVEEARRQFMLHIKYLVDRKTGLWFHGWTFDGRHNFADALWARGNCWVTIAIPEFIELLDLQPGDGLREFLLETHLQQIRTLVKHQDAGGLWHTLINDPKSYLEASATAGFAYGILKSVRKGYIGAEFEEAGIRAVKAVLANIDMTGELKNVSFGTPVFNDLDGYRKIPLTSMPYGQAMAILALGEFKRAFIMSAPARTGSLRPLPRLRQQRLPRRGRDVDHRLLDPVLLHDLLRPHRGPGRRSSSRPRGCSTRSSRRSSATSPTTSIDTWLGKKFGRRRFFILLAIPLLPSFALMWVEGQSFWYYLDHVRASSSSCTRWRSSRTKRWPRRCRPTTRPRRSSPARASSAARSPTSPRCGCPA